MSGTPPPRRRQGDPPSESLAEFDLELEQLRAVDPEHATWLAIRNLGGQTSELRHLIRSIDSRQQALRAKLLGDDGDPRDTGITGDLLREIAELRAQVHSVFSFGKAVLAALGSVVVIIAGAFISGHFKFTP